MEDCHPLLSRLDPAHDTTRQGAQWLFGKVFSSTKGNGGVVTTGKSQCEENKRQGEQKEEEVLVTSRTVRLT